MMHSLAWLGVLVQVVELYTPPALAQKSDSARNTIVAGDVYSAWGRVKVWVSKGFRELMQ